MKHLIITGIVVWTIALSASAQTQKLCSEYLSTTDASSILGGPTQAEPANGQYSRDDKLEWHFCDWRSASSKLALNVSLQRWKTEGEMRGSILTGDPKVKVERLARLGELGAVYTNHELGVWAAEQFELTASSRF